MRNRVWLLAPRVAAALCAATGSAVAQAQPLADSFDPLGGRQELIASYEQMPDAVLRKFFLRCDREASLRLLDFTEAVHCALAWDTLLKRDFGGNVDKLLAWWRVQRDLVDRQPDVLEPGR